MLVAGRRLKFILNPIIRCASFKFPENSPVETAEEVKFSISNIDQQTIEHLERLSLVNFGNEKGIKTLEEAIQFASRISSIDTEGVEPLVSVLENEVLNLREDAVTDQGNRRSVMSTSVLVEEDYYVAPPGNIPLDPKALDGSE